MLCRGQESCDGRGAADAVPVSWGSGAWKRGRLRGFAFDDGVDCGGELLAELVGFAGNAEEGSGGLFAGHGCGGFGEREGGFDEVGCVDSVWHFFGCPPSPLFLAKSSKH